MPLECTTNRFSRLAGAAALTFVSLVLFACQSTNLALNQPTNQPSGTNTLPPASGEIVGQGPVRLAVILPKSAPGNAAKVAAEYRNGAMMAYQDFGRESLQLVFKDSAGLAANAQATASEALREQSTAIIGPLFAASVTAVSSIAQPAGVPVIAFSTDSSTARRGVYLFSYTPRDDVQRTISYAASSGRRSILPFLPKNAYGNLIEARLREYAGSRGVAITQIVRYDFSNFGIEQAVQTAAQTIPVSDSIYIPDGGKVPGAVLSSIKGMKISLSGKQILGSGQWEGVDHKNSSLAGAIYAGRDMEKSAAFATRYQTAHGEIPSVHAALGYDIISLAAELIRRNGKNAFTPRVLEERNGYAGINGIFRFRSDGTVERGLAVYQIGSGTKQVVSPSPASFSAASF